MRVHQVTILAFVILLFSACKDEATEIGGGLFPDNEIISTHEYISSLSDINTSNIEANAIEFSVISSFIIGELDDPKFGNTKADFLSELSLGVRDTNKIKYTDNYELDSTRFLIKYPNNSWLGDTLAEHKIYVYQLTSLLDPLNSYKSDFDPSGMYDETNPIGEKIFNVLNGKSDSIWSQTSYIDTISIEIDEAVGIRLFEADSATISNPNAFREFFNGIYVTTDKNDDSKGSLLKLNYRSVSQELVLYYKRVNYDATANVPLDTTYFQKSFPINIEAVKVNRYSHDYTNSEIEFDNTNTQNLYIQPMAGSSSKYDITGLFKDFWLEKLANEDTINSIAGTTITFYVDTVNTDYRNYPVPSALNIYAKNEDGDYTTPLFENEFGQTTSAYSSGALSYSITDEGVVFPYKYTFTMSTGFFEEFINPQIPSNIDRKNYDELYIVPQNSSSDFNRVILHSGAVVNDEEVKITEPRANMSIKYVKLR